MEDRIKNLVGGLGLLARPIDSLSASDDLFEAGLTSYGSVQLMLALEDEFDVEFPETMLTRKTFASFAAMAAAVSELLTEKV